MVNHTSLKSDYFHDVRESVAKANSLPSAKSRKSKERSKERLANAEYKDPASYR